MTDVNPLTAVAVSGGVDSLYALVSLQEQGVPLFALHARLLPADLAPTGYEAMLERMGTTCASLNIPLHIVDCTDQFSEAVITPFIRAYAEGKTPNPCATCNASIKFGLLLAVAEQLGAARLATGHYAHLAEAPDSSHTPALFAASDTTKDQSYFLSLVPVAQFARALFPLAETTKPHVRAFLAARGICAPTPAESQEICFVPDNDYRSFVELHAARLHIHLPGPGEVTLPDGQCIGKHNGLWRYTEGQRRGLGIAWKEPLYVLAKNLSANTLIADTAARMEKTSLVVGDMNYFVPVEAWPETVYIRTRYRQTARQAFVEKRYDQGATLLFREEANGPYAAGQLATVYAKEEDENGEQRQRVLGGGIIR